MSTNFINNKIIKRQGIAKADSYSSVTEDFTVAFTGFDGISVVQENSTDTESESTRIYLDSGNKQFLKIVPNEKSGFRLSYHCTDGTAENTDWMYIDNIDRGNFVTYSIVRTLFGVAFSGTPYCNTATESVSDGRIQSFFTTMEDGQGNEINCFIHTTSANDECGAHSVIIGSEYHRNLEKLDLGKQFLGNSANHTVLLNAVSYITPLFAKHLYKKFQTEENKFGKIKINGKTFISGSHFCLECGEE